MDAQSSTLLRQWNYYLLAIASPTDRWRRNCNVMPCVPFATNMGMVLHHAPHILPCHPNQHGDQTMAASKWSLHNPQVKVQRRQKSWTWPPRKGRAWRRELWEEMQRWMQTQTYIQWHGCAIVNIVTTMKLLSSGHCFTHWQMEEELQCDALCAICYQHGNGPPPCTPHPALPPQPTWRSDDGCLWIEMTVREAGRIYG